jgi:hypothetical protein
MKRLSTLFVSTATLLSLLLVFFIAETKAQSVACPAVNAGSDITINCAAACTTLTATYTAVGATTSYSISNIAYAPVAAYNTGTPIIIGIDDRWSPLLPLPFPFCFFGTTYTNAVAGSNQILTFDATAPGNWCEWDLTWGFTIPTTWYGQGTYPAIMGPYQDIDPTYQGSTLWSVIGSAPCRKFVLNYYQTPYYGDPNSVSPFFCSSALYATSQIVLYETTNIIDIYIKDKPYCLEWNDGLAIEGIQNQTGTVAYAVPGRNNTVFSAYNDAKRFTPNGTSQVSLTWYDQNNNYLGAGASISVCPTTTTTYTVYAHYGNCPGGTTADVSDQVVVTVPTALAAAPTSTNAPCSGGLGTAFVSASGGSPAYTYLWSPSGGTGSSASNLSPGTYTIRVTDSHGCSVTSTVTITSSSNPSASSTVTTSICPTTNQTVLTSYTGNTYTDVTVCASNPSGWLTNNLVCTDPGNADCTGHFIKDSLIAPYATMGGALTAASIQSVYVSLDTIVGTNSRGCGYDNRLWLRSPGGNLYLLAAQKTANNTSTNKYKPTFTVAGSLGILPNAAGSYNLTGYRPDAGSLTAASWIGENPAAIWAGNANENYSHTAGQWQVYTNDQIGGGGCNGNGNVTKITEFCITFRTYPTLNYSWSVGAASTGACATYLTNTSGPNPIFNSPASGAYNCTYNLVVTDGSGCTAVSSVNLNCTALPIQLLSFTGKNTIFGNKLEWKTSAEINNHYFTIERSTDGVNFNGLETIESLAESGNSDHLLTYTTTDRDVKAGTYYYRLLQTDLDGQTKDMGTVLVIVKTDRDIFNVKPNPSTGIAEVTYECISDEIAFLKIYDDHGQLVMVKDFVCHKGDNSISLDLSDKAEGIYLVSVSTSENIYKTRLVLSHAR